MYSNFKEHAIQYVKQAVHEDDAGNYSKAFLLYMNALEYFRTHLKYEKNPKIKEAITQKCMEYLKRAEEIRTILDNGGSGPAPSGDATIASQPRTKSKEGVGKDVEDPKQAKLRAGLDSVIIREKPTLSGVTWPGLRVPNRHARGCNTACEVSLIFYCNNLPSKMLAYNCRGSSKSVHLIVY